MAWQSDKAPDQFVPEQHLAREVEQELAAARKRNVRVSADQMLEGMEARPRTYPDTFGIEPEVFHREIPESIRALAPALHRFEEEGGTDDEIRELFKDVYTAEKVERDISEVKRIERAIDRDDTPEGKKNALNALALEFIMKELANEWFPDCTIWKASKYDDIKRQTDLLMDVPGPEGGTFTIAIDVTYSRGQTFDKLAASTNEFRQSQFHDIEYFFSDTDDERPRGRTFVPRVVTGAGDDAVVRMAQLYNQWRRHAAADSAITKQQALERLRYHALAGEVYQGIIRQIKSGYEHMRRNLKQTPTTFIAKRESIKERGRYLDALRRSLDVRYRTWKEQRKEFLKMNGDLKHELSAPDNGVLDVILENA